MSHLDARWSTVDVLAGFMTLGLMSFGIGAGMAYAFNAWFDTSRWYELHDVRVESGEDPRAINVVTTRDIHRPFTGSYIVSLRDVDRPHPSICDGGEMVSYEPDGTVVIMSLQRWTEGATPDCISALYPGSFVLKTCVQVLHSIPMIGRREQCATSNIFQVLPARE